MIPHYELYIILPSAIRIDPETPPLPFWLKLGLGVAAGLFVAVAATLGS